PLLRWSRLGVLVAQLLRRVPGRARDRQERRYLLRPLAEGDAAADPHRDARPADRHLLGGADRAHRSNWSGRPEPGAHGPGGLRPHADPRRLRTSRPRRRSRRLRFPACPGRARRALTIRLPRAAPPDPPPATTRHLSAARAREFLGRGASGSIAGHMRTHPVFLCLEGRSCVAIGGDQAIEGKVRACLLAGATVTLVAGDPTPALREL